MSMAEYQTHEAVTRQLYEEVSRLKAINAELVASIQKPVQADTSQIMSNGIKPNNSLVQAARQALEVLSELAEWESEGDPRHPASAAITALRGALDAAPADSSHEAFKIGYAKGVDDAERRAKARGEQPAAVVKKPVSAIHLGWDRLDNGQLVATYFLPVAEMAAPKLYTTPQPARQPLSDDWIRGMCKESWVFEAAKQWIRIAERAHGIGGEA